ncbi:Peroxidase 66 [Hibiscus syriacus]|uniref:peroxidase n=1 Tax=Hibiscus syriacus TaxID=106335 RepID=A0A6A2WQF0_HIBSY|nr:Peroxidase 66 [Hibiscus syriacus]
MEFVVALCFAFLLFPFPSAIGALSSNYYDDKCPHYESIIRNVVKKATIKDRTVPSAILRMHFHDCFIRGCNCSVVHDSKGKKKAEKDGAPNRPLHAFYVIDSAKKALEAECSGVVSCADILALVARDSVVLTGGPYWEVPSGRKDGRISLASDVKPISQQVILTIRGLRLEGFLDDSMVVSAKLTLNDAGEQVVNPTYLRYVKQDSSLASWLRGFFPPLAPTFFLN